MTSRYSQQFSIWYTIMRHWSQYVGVAGGHRNIMNLGGNLPDSLAGYLQLGHESNVPESPRVNENTTNNTSR